MWVGSYDEIVPLLVESGADTDMPDGRGVTALMYAAAQGFTPTVQALVEAGADMEVRISAWVV